MCLEAVECLAWCSQVPLTKLEHFLSSGGQEMKTQHHQLEGDANLTRRTLTLTSYPGCLSTFLPTDNTLTDPLHQETLILQVRF